ncbi:MAG: hypothetical protein QXR19_17770 [Candidatus Jordarchaeaceae archaeon]
MPFGIVWAQEVIAWIIQTLINLKILEWVQQLLGSLPVPSPPGPEVLALLLALI